ncbi:MAG: uracil-DNA glycosylase [Methylibium sp.]|uniref:uracil-DNA glycosylase n=1 Tax=Methylibium sp. TaxID=2067992 RepID=UPI001848DC5A|nr:uracil-DNA glycosylase [Methylibium sp.]MBA3599559.1 uracil-DNA glycosylase [Methylibium sp.]
MTGRLERPLDQAFDEIEGGWRPVTEAFRTSLTGRRLIEFIDARVAAGTTVFPADPLRALRLTPLEAARVVILGQDPYHGAGQAEGMAFSVPADVKPPPSLRNMFKELQRDLGVPSPRSGSLLPWARRGVLLLNTVLTVEEGRPASHAKQGWEALTDMLIDAIAAQPSPLAFLLWGAAAQAKAARIAAASSGHRVWTANHPSPLSAARPPQPFVGCAHFGAAAAFLGATGRPFDWSL